MDESISIEIINKKISKGTAWPSQFINIVIVIKNSLLNTELI